MKRADVTGDATGVIRTGLLGEIDRFKLYRSNQLNHATETVDFGSGGVNAEAFNVIAGIKNATTFASQITKTETLTNPNRFGELWRTLNVFGREVIEPKALAELYCVKDMSI